MKKETSTYLQDTSEENSQKKGYFMTVMHTTTERLKELRTSIFARPTNRELSARKGLISKLPKNSIWHLEKSNKHYEEIMPNFKWARRKK